MGKGYTQYTRFSDVSIYLIAHARGRRHSDPRYVYGSLLLTAGMFIFLSLIGGVPISATDAALTYRQPLPPAAATEDVLGEVRAPRELMPSLPALPTFRWVPLGPVVALPRPSDLELLNSPPCRYRRSRQDSIFLGPARAIFLIRGLPLPALAIIPGGSSRLGKPSLLVTRRPTEQKAHEVSDS